MKITRDEDQEGREENDCFSKEEYTSLAFSLSNLSVSVEKV